ncbi:MAG: anti-sigma factor [Anaerolineae bacterium]
MDINGSNQNEIHKTITAENAADHLAVLTLGGLTSSEEAELDKLIAEDPELALELQMFSDVTDSLAYLQEPIMPSAKTEEMLFKRVEANAQARFLISPSTTQVFKARIPQKKKLRSVTQIFDNVFRQPSFGVGLVASALILAGLTGLLGARLGTVSNTNQALRDELDANRVAKAELEQQMVTLNQELDAANGFVTTYENQLTEVLQQNQQLQELADTAQLSRDEVATQVAGLLSDNDGLLSRNSALEERIAAQNEILDLFSSVDSEAINIGGTARSPESSATIVFNPNSDVAILLVSDLPQLESEEVYQVLLIRGTEHDTAETFTVNAEGKNILVVKSPSPLSIFDTIGVSVEPVGGSAQRTGDVVLVGEIASN